MFQSRHLQPVDDQIKTKYYLSSLILFPIIFMAAIFNYSQDLHMFPPHENCLRSEIIVNPFKFFFSFIFPLIIILGLNLFFDSNQWQRPQRNHIYMKDIYSVIYNQIRIKSSTVTVLLLLVINNYARCSKKFQLSWTFNQHGRIADSFLAFAYFHC